MFQDRSSARGARSVGTMAEPGRETRVIDESGIGPDLVRWGRAARIETRSRRTGRVITAFVSFHEEADGSIVVAAGTPGAVWARNLAADGEATVTIGERSFRVAAEELVGAEYAAAVRELILKGGTPAERLGHGPAFRLRRAGEAGT
jgi:deazaflavin-dependent oxidoreductase (nitroreductase family)